MKRNKILIVLLILIFLLIFVFRVVFSTSPLVANDFPYLSSDEIVARFSVPYAWWNRGTAGLGEYTIPFLWFWPMDFVYGLVGNLGGSFSLLERIFGVFPAIVLGVLGIRRLMKRYKLSETSMFVGSLIYILNTYFILLIDGGQLGIALAYSLTPFAFSYFLDAFDKKTLHPKIVAAFVLSIYLLFDIRFVYVLGILLIVYFFFELFFIRRNSIIQFFSKAIVIGSISCIFLLGLLAYMVVPALFAESISPPSGYDRVTQTNFLGFTTLANAILLLQPHWYKNVFGNLTQLRFEFVIFPLLAFSAPLLHRRNKTIAFWTLVALIGVFLTKGAHEPLGEVYLLLFNYIPGFSLFRDSTKFFVLIAISFSILSAFTVDRLLSFFKKKWGSKAAVIFPIAIACYFLLITFPVWTGRMTGMLSLSKETRSLDQVKSLLSNDSLFGRVLWIPSRTPLSYADDSQYAIEAMRIVNLRPFAIGVAGSYEIFNFLRDAPFIGQILDISGIKYIAYPYPDENREELKEDNKVYYDTFLSQIIEASWSDGRITEKPIPLIKTKKSKDHLYLAPNHYFILGSDRIYWDLSEIPDFDLSKNALTFIEEKRDPLDFQKYPDSKVILYDKEILDLILSQVPDEDIFSIANELNFEPGGNGWWKREGSDLIQWRAFLQEKYGLDMLEFDYGKGWSIAEGNLKLQIVNDSLKKGGVLFVRLMKSTKGGSVTFFQGNEKIGAVNTNEELPEYITLTVHGYGEVPNTNLEYEDTHVLWQSVGTLVSDEPITITTSGDINVVNALAVIDEDKFIEISKKVDDLEMQNRILYWNSISEIEKHALFQSNAVGSVTYNRINPTHYKVKVEGITRPQTLVFSENFNSLWQLAGQSTFPVYSILNGFVVSENGEYDLYFTAQKYVNYGLVISAVTLTVLVTLLIYLRKK